ncbi:hypothetical protein FACS189429_3730 [Bacteroidia bacterium]|nr:hypothetical protein FACS189429_3730 [Bacteroidia bacterium]GHV44299.1 hypothetical protein FACS1894180_5480 [Bacteroidia bacterium]
MKKIRITILYFFAFAFTSNAQTYSGNVNDNAGNPVEFANVILLQTTDSTFIAGTVTDSLGNFRLQVPENQYFIKISAVGYLPFFEKVSSGNIGTITLFPDEKMLAEVTITAARPTYKMEQGGVSANVQNTFLATVGTAQEVLAQLPFVNAAKDKITVFGKGEPLIYLNNQLLRDKSELEQLNSNQIKKVTVITNPDAQYDATVQSVIRIETIRRQGDGFSGSAMTRITLDKRFSHNETINLNYRKGNFDVFGMLRYGKIGDLIALEMSQKTKSNTAPILAKQTGEQEQKSHYIRANIGANYAFNDNHSAGVKFQTNQPIDNDFSLNSVFTAQKNGVLESSFKSKLTSKDTKNKPFSNYLNAYYEGKFADFLTAKLNFDYAKGAGGSLQTVENFRQDSTETVQTNDENNYDLYAAKLIFTSPLWNGQLNYGYEFSKTVNNQYFDVLQKGNSEVLNSAQNTARQLLNAAFLSYSHEFGKFAAEISLRYENIDFQYFNNGVKELEPSKTYDNFFPSAILAYQTDNLQMQFAYRNSTYRPSYYQLRSEMQYDNPYMYEGGNPYLKPMIINTLSCLFVWENLQTEISYNFYENQILFIPSLLQENIIFFQPQNLEKSQNFTFTAAYSPTFRFWKPSWEVGLTKDFLTYDTPPANYNKPIFSFAFKNNFQFSKTWNLSANSSYESGGHSAAAYSYANFNFDILLTKHLFDKKLRINIGADDIFGTSRQKNIMENGAVWSYYWKDLNTRNIYLSINYNFNATRSKYKGEKATDELNRL